MAKPNMDQIPPKIMELVSPELLEQAKQCETEEEAIALLQDGGVEIPDEVLDEVAGGYWGGGGGGCTCDWFRF